MDSKGKGFWPYPEDRVASFFKAQGDEQEEKPEKRYEDAAPILETIKSYLEERPPNNFYSSDVLLDLLEIKGPSLRLRASRALFLFGHQYNIHPRIHSKNKRPYYGRADEKSGEPNFIDTAEQAAAIVPQDNKGRRDLRIF